MRRTSHYRASLLWTVLALSLAPVAGAAAPTLERDLDLTTTVQPRGFTLGLDASRLLAPAEIGRSATGTSPLGSSPRAGALRLGVSAGAWRRAAGAASVAGAASAASAARVSATVALEDTMDSESPAKEKRGFGHWLKRRWYIPVVAGVLLGVTLTDDDDSNEIESD